MARTRAATGNSKPRVVEQVEAAVTGKKRATTKKTGAASNSKANTSKPRAKVASGRVEKKSAAPKKAATTKKTATTKKAAPKSKSVDKKLAAEAAKHETEVTEAEAKEHHEPTLLDTISGAALKVQGFITGSSGKKAAGTAKIRGTDGKKPAKK